MPTPAAADKSTDAAEQHALPDAVTNGNVHDSSHDADSSDAEEAITAGDMSPITAEDRGAQAAAASATAAAVRAEVQAGEDVFDETELDPANCRAIESSLWELESLRHHYYHTVRCLDHTGRYDDCHAQGITACMYLVLSDTVWPALQCMAPAQVAYEWQCCSVCLCTALGVQSLASATVQFC